MLYGINYRNFHDAIHGIALFQKKKDAEQALEILKAYESGETGKDMTNDDLSQVFETEVWGKTVSIIEQIHYRVIEPLMKNLTFFVNEQGNVNSIKSNVRIINPQLAVDIY